MSASRRQFIAGAGAAGLAAAGRAAPPSDELTPEMFGAKGDGRTNDTDAFAALSTHVNARGGGKIVLRRRTYLVGKQGPSGKFAFSPSDILHFVGCRNPIVIRGNGTILRCAPGLLYGGFDRSGKALPDSRSNLSSPNQAIPYFGMIHAERCSGDIDISDLELDGNLAGLRIGGKSGPSGWQAGASGIRLMQNSGSEHLSRIHSHHHAQDGIILTAAPDRLGTSTVTEAICELNGRVGCSITGGRNYVLERCRFRRNGKDRIRSAPASGVDIEAERPPIRNVVFTDCEFSDNSGFGLVSGSVKKTSDVRCTRCKFVGTTNLAAAPHTPNMRFTDCLFVGQINHVYADADAGRAAQFVGCTFTDDPKLSPTGEVYLGRPKGKYIAIVLEGPNVLFSHCRFRLVGDGAVPLSGKGVIYADCDMSQRAPTASSPRGTYLGTTSITGNAHLEGSTIRGKVTLNGRLVPVSG